MLQNLCFTFIMLMVWTSAYGAEGTKIVVASDIHVMAPSLLPDAAKTQSAWQTYYAGQRKMLEESATIFNTFTTASTRGVPATPSSAPSGTCIPTWTRCMCFLQPTLNITIVP